MAFAAGFGGHAGFGFGLGFLNLIGTVLFFFFIFWAVKMVARGMRFSSGRGNFNPGFGCGTRRGNAEDDAMKVARERLAKSELSPEEFATLKEGLRTSAPHGEATPYRQDSALTTARMRFAQGEISREEFEAVKKALMG